MKSEKYKKKKPLTRLFFLVAGVGFFIALHQIIVASRRSPAPSLCSLIWRFLLAYPLPPPEVVIEIQNLASRSKKNRHPMGVCSFLVAEVGFEPHDLRVMSPTSYQAALLRDIEFFRLYRYGAGDRGRTGTILSYHGILSPGRLPVPPHRRFS